MMNIADLLARGYFPLELPPPFTTAAFSSFVTTAATRPTGYLAPPASKPVTTKAVVHSVARAGALRRRLSIPNPIAYEQLATVVVDNWPTLLAHTSGSPISLTTPRSTPGTGRAIVPVHSFESWTRERARVRAGQRFVLKADIASFYGSVYTHSIPWAMHGKAVAKAARGLSHLGNLLDVLVRNGQDQQTIGIPIGPDTSLLLAEVLLSPVDKALPASMPSGLRYVDDYEFGCATQAEAEGCLAVIEEQLASLELQLNPRKTSIRALPLPLEESWTPEIRLYRIRKGVSGQATDLLSFFGKAFALQPGCPEASLLKYAVSRTRSEPIREENWQLYEALLLQCAAVEPGSLSTVVSQLLRYSAAGYAIGLVRVRDTFNRVIHAHGAVGHGSEVAWALWGAIELGCTVSAAAAASLSASNDAVVALLSLDAQARGLIPAGLDTSRWEALLTSADLRGSAWLLTYEAFVKGWLRPPGGSDIVSPDTYFAWLRDGGVSFYDTASRLPVTPPPPTPSAPSAASAEATAEDALLLESFYGF